MRYMNQVKFVNTQILDTNFSFLEPIFIQRVIKTVGIYLDKYMIHHF